MKKLTKEEAQALTMTKTKQFIAWVDGMNLLDSILVTLPEGTGFQTFRTSIGRHYGGKRKFSMKKTASGIVVTRIK